MTVSADVLNDVEQILREKLSVRKGRIIPTVEDVAATGAVEFPVTFLYADLANSTRLASQFATEHVAKIYKAYLATCARAIRASTGQIRSYDGDRILGVFLHDRSAERATRCALEIAGLLRAIVWPALYAKLPFLYTAGFELRHGAGLDHGQVTAISAGTRAARDLVWIGRAPNIAAKLSSLRSGKGNTVVTSEVLSHLPDELLRSEGQSIWQSEVWDGGLTPETVYVCSRHIPPSIPPMMQRRLERYIKAS